MLRGSALLLAGACLLDSVPGSLGFSLVPSVLPRGRTAGHLASSTSKGPGALALAQGQGSSSNQRRAVLGGLKLSASDPDQAWKSFQTTGDSSEISKLITEGDLTLETSTGEEVSLSGLVGDGKALVVFMRHVGWPFCWELAANVNKMLPTLLADGVKVIVCSRASPTKLREFAEAADALPIENLYCSRDGSVYSGLGFYDNFGAKGLGGLAAGRLSLQRVQEMGEEGRAKMAETTKNYTKFNPVGLVSGKMFSLDDAKAATQLGGGFAVSGGKVVYAHRDLAVADHADLEAAAKALGVSLVAA